MSRLQSQAEDRNERLQMKLRELERAKAESMQSKMEEMKRELARDAESSSGQPGSKEREEENQRKRVSEWRDKVSRKRNEKLQMERQRRSTFVPTAALLNLFGRQVDALTRALEEEETRQREAMEARITKKKMDKITKFGDLLTKAEVCPPPTSSASASNRPSRSARTHTRCP